MGKSQRVKGHAFERYVAKLFRPIFPQARRGRQVWVTVTCPDVDGTPYWIECKVGQFPNPVKAWEQALSDQKKAGDTREPLVVVKKDHGQVLVMMSFNEFYKRFSESEDAPSTSL